MNPGLPPGFREFLEFLGAGTGNSWNSWEQGMQWHQGLGVPVGFWDEENFGMKVFQSPGVPVQLHPRNPGFLGIKVGDFGQIQELPHSKGWIQEFAAPSGVVPRKSPFPGNSWEFLLLVPIFPTQSHQTPHPEGEFFPGIHFWSSIFSQKRRNSSPGRSWGGKTSGICIFPILELGFFIILETPGPFWPQNPHFWMSWKPLLTKKKKTF